MKKLIVLSFIAVMALPFAALAESPIPEPIAPAPVHAMALHGMPKYPPGFAHVDYVNPDAPKGGTLKLNAIGSFDSLNPFIVKGTPAAGLTFIRSGLVYESLM